MNGQNNTRAWVIGLIVLVLIAAGFWWYMGGTMTPSTSNISTSTPNGAATTTTGTPVVRGATSSGTVASVVAGLTEDGSQFKALFSSTGVAANLTGKGPYTVFVPVDNAFNNVTPGTISGMTAAQKKRLVQYHVVSGKSLDVDALSAGKHTALSKDVLNFNVDVDQGTAFVNSGLIIKQYKASNGIVYLVGAVLIPPPVAAPGTGTN